MNHLLEKKNEWIKEEKNKLMLLYISEITKKKYIFISTVLNSFY